HGEGWAGDLAKQGIKDENVFEITTGVAITMLVKSANKQSVADVSHREMTGSYEDKARLLTEPELPMEATQVVLDSHHYFPFTPQGEAGNDEYWTWPQVDTLFKASVDGIKTSRDGLVIASTREGCRQKILNFAGSNAGIDDIERQFSVSAKGFDIRGAQRHLKKHFDEELIHPILYRPFDIRYIYYDKELILSHRMNVMPSMFHKQAWSLVFASRLSSKGFDHVIACAALCAHKCASHDINSRMFPVVGLFRPLLAEERMMSNLSDGLLETMPMGNEGSEVGRASEIGEYLYAVVNAPSYRSRYHESISQDFPRAPLTTSSEFFTRLCEKGRALVNLHTLREAPPGDAFLFSGSNNDSLSSPSWKNNTLTIGNSSKITGVERGVWEFRMCGYDVCKSWFSAGWKARIQREGESLTKACVLQVRTMLWSIRETIRIRQEIDDVIGEFGGWPIT
ncbi:MAG: type ISP restriction/modification enzyme, partial [Chthoniobacteraceae bacterium]